MPIVIPYLAGRLPQGRLGVGWKVLSRPVAPAASPTLTVREVDARARPSSARWPAPARRPNGVRLVEELMGAATAEEQRFLLGLLTGEVRQGALDAVAVGGSGAGHRRARGRRAAGGDAGRVAADGGAGAARRGAPGRWRRSGSPSAARCCRCSPTPPSSVAEAVGRLGACAVEEKLDGIRVQVHRDGDEVRLYTRTLDDITDRLPEVTEAARRLAGSRFVLDGEVIAFDEAGRPRSFQETAGRVGSRVDVAAAAEAVPVSPVFFDALSVDGRDLLDLPFAERHAELARLAPEPLRVRRTLVSGPDDVGTAEEFSPADPAARARGSGRQGPGRALQRRAARRVLAEGEARAHPRPGGAGRRVGPRAAHRQALQSAPRRARRRTAAS